MGIIITLLIVAAVGAYVWKRKRPTARPSSSGEDTFDRGDRR